MFLRCFADLVLDDLIASGQLDGSNRQHVRSALLCRHTHQGDRKTLLRRNTSEDHQTRLDSAIPQEVTNALLGAPDHSQLRQHSMTGQSPVTSKRHGTVCVCTLSLLLLRVTALLGQIWRCGANLLPNESRRCDAYIRPQPFTHAQIHIPKFLWWAKPPHVLEGAIAAAPPPPLSCQFSAAIALGWCSILECHLILMLCLVPRQKGQSFFLKSRGP